MKTTKNLMKFALTVYAVVLLMSVVVGQTTKSAGDTGSAPGQISEPPAQGADSAKAKTLQAAQWTCPMHPEIRKSESGKCPICKMDLIKKSDEDPAGKKKGHGRLKMQGD